MYQAVKKIKFSLFCLCSKKWGKFCRVSFVQEKLCKAINRGFGADLVTFEIPELHKILNPGRFLINFQIKIAVRLHSHRKCCIQTHS